MARFGRFTQKIFGSGGNVGTAGFGGAASGNVSTNIATSSSLTTLQSLSQWASGWLSASLGASKFPALEDMNAVEYVVTNQLAYILQQGIPEYDSGTTYFTNNVCMKAGTFQLYGSLTDNNLGNALTSTGNWQLLYDFSVGNGRTKLTANTTYYVATTGSDSNPGTSGSPWLTIQHAISYLQANIDLGGFTATIQVADGTYTGSVSVSYPFSGNGIVLLQGNITTPANCIISVTSANCINMGSNALMSIQGFRLKTTTSGNCINLSGSSILSAVGIMDYNTCAGVHINVTQNAQYITNANYNITGGAIIHWDGSSKGYIGATALTITITGTPAFTYFGATSLDALLDCFSITFSGSATGTRYLATSNSIINTNGGGATYLPGNVAGSTSTGGIYV